MNWLVLNSIFIVSIIILLAIIIFVSGFIHKDSIFNSKVYKWVMFVFSVLFGITMIIYLFFILRYSRLFIIGDNGLLSGKIGDNMLISCDDSSSDDSSEKSDKTETTIERPPLNPRASRNPAPALAGVL